MNSSERESQELLDLKEPVRDLSSCPSNCNVPGVRMDSRTSPLEILNLLIQNHDHSLLAICCFPPSKSRPILVKVVVTKDFKGCVWRVQRRRVRGKEVCILLGNFNSLVFQITRGETGFLLLDFYCVSST